MWELTDIVLRSAAVATLLLVAVLLAIHAGSVWPGRLGALFALGVACHLICPFLVRPPDPGWIKYPVFFACFGVPAFLWTWSRSIFDDGFRPHLTDAAALAVVELAGFWRLSMAGESVGTATDYVVASAAIFSQIPGLLIVILVLVQAWTGLTADLVEARRRFRRALIVVFGTYAIVVVAVELSLQGSPASPQLSAFHALLVLLIAFSLAVKLLRPTEEQLWEKPRPKQLAVDPAERDLAELVRQSMGQKELFRTEGLTIGMLATQLGVQEYRLRNAINRHLGFRNFNDFVNQHRIALACSRLADPGEARLPILSIALDLGFRSIGPFNRAFKQITGLTPTEFRQRHVQALKTGQNQEKSH